MWIYRRGVEIFLIINILFFYKVFATPSLQGCGSLELSAFRYLNIQIISLTIPDDNLDTLLAIMAAMWISGITIIVFVLGKTGEIIYGIKYSNVICWAIKKKRLVLCGICYVLLFPTGLWVYQKKRMSALFWLTMVCFMWIVGAGFFVVLFCGKRCIIRTVRRTTVENVKKICKGRDAYSCNIEKVSQLPLMKMIRNIEYNDPEETGEVKKCIREIADKLDKYNIKYRYLILMPVVSAYCEQSGYSDYRVLNRTIDFFTDLLHTEWTEEKRLWIQCGIVLPLVEKLSLSGNNMKCILKRFPMHQRKRVILISLLYLEYLNSCMDVKKDSVFLLWDEVTEEILNGHEAERNEAILYDFWISWNILDGQKSFRSDIFYRFIKECGRWSDIGYIPEAWVLKTIKMGKLIK